ncbi:TetR/AcrR family transcriptional regulator [Paenibacillus daejeonensis]|uniref:TetR/AcrR family transcriptional regulator n=1 Tax=Paenibacillus daejeonensis TaxID=135193 RepID=UPI0003618F7F|nr:TetR/AcrR family transcriptional regulator [Paenibacillus daejeonensis]
MGLRERKKEETRKSILAQAGKLFEARGYQQVTTAEIAKTAGIAEGTLFNYYRSKGELFVAAMMPEREGASEAPAVLETVSSQHLTAAIVSMLGQELAMLQRVSRSLLQDYFSLVYSGASRDSLDARAGLFAADDRMLQQLQAYLEEQRAAHPMALNKLDVPLASACIFGCVVTLLSQYVMVESWSYETLLESMTDQIDFILTGHV